jgi:ribosomal protein S18 acetylase RimI-like enzyme
MRLDFAGGKMNLHTDASHASPISNLPHPADPKTSQPRRWAPIRTLGERHAPRVLEHLLALNDADRLLRFGYLASDAGIRHYAEQLNYDSDQIFGIFNRGLKLVALVHLAFGAAGRVPGGAAEFGISVLPRQRGQGLGGLLFDRAITHARNRGLGTLLIHLARDNAPMLAIVRRAGAQVSFEGGDVLAELPLPADTLGSHIQELLEHQAAELDYRLKLQVLRLRQLQA